MERICTATEPLSRKASAIGRFVPVTNWGPSESNMRLDDDVREKRLVRILPGWKVPARPLHVVYVRDRQMTPKLRCFIDFVAERFKAA